MEKKIECNPENIRPIFSLNSIQDHIIPQRGGLLVPHGMILSTSQTNELVSKINGCRSEFVGTDFIGSRSTCVEYKGCKEKFKHCNLDNRKQPLGGHVIYFNDDKLNVAKLIWNFFKSVKI